MAEIIALTWIQEGEDTKIHSARIIQVSAASAELNLKVAKRSQYPKYAPITDIDLYFKEKPTSVIEPVSIVSDTKQKKKKPTEEIEPQKPQKPVFKTVEEKQAWEAENKAQ